jgi:hypothetical protein
MMLEQLGADRTVRLLKAKAVELEHVVHSNDVVRPTYLAADLALVAGILADLIESLSPVIGSLEDPISE